MGFSKGLRYAIPLSVLLWVFLFLLAGGVFGQVSLENEQKTYSARRIELIPSFTRTCNKDHVCTATIRNGLYLNIKEDPEFPVNLVSFNGSHVALQFSSVVSNKETDIPLKVDRKTIENVRLTTKLFYDDELKQNIEVIDNTPIRWFNVSDDVIKWGFNSTEVTFTSNITHILEDAEFDEDSTRNGLETTASVDKIDNTGETFVIKLNLSVIPVGSEISVFELCLKTTGAGGTVNDIAMFYSSNQTWKEEDIDDLCGDGVMCDDLNQFMEVHIGNVTFPNNNQYYCFSNYTIGHYANLSIGGNLTFYFQDNGTNEDAGAFYTKDIPDVASRPYFNITYTYWTDDNISFVDSTPANESYQTQAWAEINISLNATDLMEWTYELNGVNYTFFNDSLLVYFNFNNETSLGESNTAVHDLTGNFDSLSNSTPVDFGYFQGSHNFTSYLDTINIGTFNLGNFTVCFWLYLNELATTSGNTFKFFAKYDTCTASRTVNVQLNTANDRIFMETSATGAFDGANSVSIPRALTINQWYHVCAVYEPTFNQLYVNGTFRAQTNRNSDGLYRSTEPIYLGTGSCGGNLNDDFNGSLDDFILINQSLSAEEINQLYMQSIQKYDVDKYYYYINQTRNATHNLQNGNYTINSYARNEYYYDIQTFPQWFFVGTRMFMYIGYNISTGVETVNYSDISGYIETNYTSSNYTSTFLWLQLNGTTIFNTTVANNTAYTVPINNITVGYWETTFGTLYNTTTSGMINITNITPAGAPTAYNYVRINITNNSRINISLLDDYIACRYLSGNQSPQSLSLVVNGTVEHTASVNNNTWHSWGINNFSVGLNYIYCNITYNTTGGYNVNITNISGIPVPETDNSIYLPLGIFLLGAIFVFLYVGRTSEVKEIRLFLSMVCMIVTVGIVGISYLLAEGANINSNILRIIAVVFWLMGMVVIFMMIYTAVMFIYFILGYFEAKKLEKEAPKLWNGRAKDKRTQW